MTRTAALKLTVVGAIAISVLVALALDGLDVIRDQDRIEDFLTESGPWGPVVFMLCFVALQPLSLPGAVLIIPATFVWPWWEVAIYSLAGGMLASTLGFALSRWLARDWVRERIPRRLEPWEQRVSDHGFWATVALRLLTGYAPAADWLLGVSRVRVAPFLAGTLVGLAPTTLAASIWGDDAVRGLRDLPVALTVPVLVAVAVVGAIAVRRGRAEGDAAAETPRRTN
jgi:uncharacterized membrane protein YdjX (TVP38/TMEM64 family)